MWLTAVVIKKQRFSEKKTHSHIVQTHYTVLSYRIIDNITKVMLMKQVLIDGLKRDALF